MSADDAYNGLMEQLGFPGSTRLRAVMDTLMTPDEARIVAALPGTPQEAAEKTGMDLNRVVDTLDSLFFRGIALPKGDFRRREYYRFSRSITQFHDATVATRQIDVEKDRPLLELWQDFKLHEQYPYYAKRDKARGYPIQRIVPAHKAIKDLDGVLPYEDYVEILKAQSRIAVVPCPCRTALTFLGKPCHVHDETAHWACLQSGRAAEYAVVRGSGRELSLEEALELNDIIEESGLLHTIANNSAMSDFRTSCNCCNDCCEIAVSLDQAALPRSLTWEKSRYLACVNLDDCDGCQVCVDRCLFDAIEMERAQDSKKYKAVIDAEKCFGCGNCVIVCKPGALKMKAVRPPEHIPAAPAA